MRLAVRPSPILLAILPGILPGILLTGCCLKGAAACPNSEQNVQPQAVQSDESDQSESRMLTPEMQRRDFDLLTKQLSAKHPGLLRYLSPQDLAEAQQQLRTRLDKPRSPLEFYRLLAPCVARIRCLHTLPEPPDVVQQMLETSKRLLPLQLYRSDGRWWVLKDLSDDAAVAKGSELLAINGRRMSEIESQILPALTCDGFNQTGPLFVLEQYFPVLYALHVECTADEFVLDLADGGGTRSQRRVSGVGQDQAMPEEGSSQPFGCTFVEPDHALIDVRYFGAPGFESFLQQTFRRLQQENTKTVTLDLRGNGGGTDDDGVLLCTYLLDQPFGYFERIEVTPSYQQENPGESVKTDTKSRLVVTAPRGLRRHKPNKLAFSGRLFVLIDGGTFSTAADVASVLYSHGAGTFVGEESGGGFAGNTSGTSDQLQLPFSGISIAIPRWKYTTATGPRRSTLGRQRGVPVAHEVRATIQERLRGEDVGMRTVRQLMDAPSAAR